MSDRRSEERVRIELRVKVSGVDARCENFSEHALATNISRSGALLSKITTQLRCGDLLISSTETDGRTTGSCGCSSRGTRRHEGRGT